jgi:hypothetical protein
MQTAYRAILLPLLRKPKTGNRKVMTLFTEQQQYQYCVEIMKEIKAGAGSKFFITDDDPLYVGHNLEDGRLIVPNKLIKLTIEMHPDKAFA